MGMDIEAPDKPAKVLTLPVRNQSPQMAAQKPPASAAQVLSVLESSEFFSGVFGMSEWSGRVVVLRETELFGKTIPAGFWDERLLPYLQGQFETMEGVQIKFSLDNLRAGIKAHALDNPSNPVREYLEKSLAHWEDAGRPENIANHLRDYFGVKDNVYTREVSRNFFISAVARAMAPGCPVPSIVVLEGAEGVGKSRWAPSLMPEDKGPLGDTVKWTSQIISGDPGTASWRK
jgi:putative DNA primase/helicase